MKARIFQKPKNAMQSGRAGTQRWMLEFAPAEARKADPLMGWAGSGDTRRQLRLGFASRDEALAYAARNGIEAEVVPTPARTLKIQAYADNFRSEEHTSELQSLMRISYAVFCLKKKKKLIHTTDTITVSPNKDNRQT